MDTMLCNCNLKCLASATSNNFISFLYRYDQSSTKTPVRRVDSGPATDSQRFDSSNYKYPMSNVDVVLVNATQPIDQNMSRASAPAVTQSKSRRDLVSLSTGDELNSNYQSQHNYQNLAIKTSPQHLLMSQNYAQYGKGQPQPDDIPGKSPLYSNTPKGMELFCIKTLLSLMID